MSSGMSDSNSRATLLNQNPRLCIGRRQQAQSTTCCLHDQCNRILARTSSVADVRRPKSLFLGDIDRQVEEPSLMLRCMLAGGYTESFEVMKSTLSRKRNETIGGFHPQNDETTKLVQWKERQTRRWKVHTGGTVAPSWCWTQICLRR